MDQSDLVAYLQDNPWFGALSGEHLDKFLKIAKGKSWPAGATIFREASKDQNLYIVIEGQVALDIYIPNHGKVSILTVGPDEIFGWSAVLPVVDIKTATARAIQPTTAVALDSKGLGALCEADHHLGYLVYRRLTNILSGRLTATRLQLLDMYATGNRGGGA